MRNELNIIVPVYNVERYLEKCLNSLLNQNTVISYTVILVNDGSTDESGTICKNFAKKYPNKFYYYEKTNGGLSSARNFGVNKSTADYVIFVDSDDFVSKNFVQDLMEPIVHGKADMVVSPITKFFESENTIIEDDVDVNYSYMNADEAFIELCYERLFGSYAVSKAIKTSLIKEFQFPNGKYFEDSYTLYKVILKSKRIAYLNKSNYYYLQRNGSIQRHHFEDRHLDLVYAGKEIYDCIKSNTENKELVEAAQYKLFRSLYITLIHASEESLPKYKSIYKRCMTILPKGKDSLPPLNRLGIKEKAFKYILNFGDLGTYAVFKIYRRKSNAS